MTLVDHARYELSLIDCSQREKAALLAAVEGFATGGWSGGSAGWGIQTLVRLLEFKPLTQLTTDPDEWNLVSGPTTQFPDSERLWQSKRRGTTFSRDGGHTWYDIDDPSLNNGDVWKRDEAEWEDVALGVNVRVGSRVRVRVDAFDDGRLASLHNGREGELVSVDSGLCMVRYDDGNSFRHGPGNLQVLLTSV